MTNDESSGPRKGMEIQNPLLLSMDQLRWKMKDYKIIITMASEGGRGGLPFTFQYRKLEYIIFGLWQAV